MFSEEKELIIAQRYHAGETGTDLAAEFYCCVRTIFAIARRYPSTEPKVRGQRQSLRDLTMGIYEDHLRGDTYCTIRRNHYLNSDNSVTHHLRKAERMGLPIKWRKAAVIQTTSPESPPKSGLKIFISGPMTGYENYNRATFNAKEKELAGEGRVILNPAIHPDGLTHAEYISLCYAMIRIAEVVVFLPKWYESKGALLEHSYAEKIGKRMVFPGEVV